MRRDLFLFVLAISMSACTDSAQTRAATQVSSLADTWTKLDCRGTKQALLTDGQIDGSEPNSTDEMQIVRRPRSLLVTINGAAMRKVMKRDGYATDIYTITNIDKDGLAAAHGYSLYPTVHSLVINAVGDRAVWTEASIAFYTADKQPKSTAVFFTCVQGQYR